MPLPNPPALMGDDSIDIHRLYDYLYELIDAFPNAVGEALDPTEGEGGDGSITITSAPANVTYTPSSVLDDNGVPSGNIIVAGTFPEFAVGIRIYYRLLGETDFKQSYGTELPYTVIALLSAKTYEFQTAGEAANGAIGPKSVLTQVTIPFVAPAIDHGNLVGLVPTTPNGPDNDDHTQYFPRNGVRDIFGDVEHTGTNIGWYGVTPVVQAAAEASLTDNTGAVADNIIAEVKRSGAIAFPFNSPAGVSGIFYFGGFYDFASSHNDFSPSTTHGTANAANAAHIFIVVGVSPAGSDTVVRVTGTSITDTAVRVTSDTEDITITDGTAVNTYLETSKKFLGQVTLSVLSGTPVNCNYGAAKYWDGANQDFTITDLEANWLGGANDTGANILLRHHKLTGWTYNAGSEPTPPTALIDMVTDYVTEVNIVNGENGDWKRVDLSLFINGSASEGIIFEVVTAANRTFELGAAQIAYSIESPANDNFADLTAKVNKLLANDRNWGQMAT